MPCLTVRQVASITYPPSGANQSQKSSTVPVEVNSLRMESGTNARLALLGALGGTTLALAAAAWASRFWLGQITRKTLRNLLTDPYAENLLELLSATRRTSLQTILENSLRAETGQVIKRPLGSPKHYPGLDHLIFDLAQLHRLPTPEDTPIDLSVTLGPTAARPLHLQIPLIVAGMGYGVALSAQACIAIARGAAWAGTASNTGEGAWLPAERREAHHLILQYNRGSWAKDRAILGQADMIEIQLGQGALGGLGHKIPAHLLGDRLRQAFSLPPGEPPISHARQPGVNSPADLRTLVNHLREITAGVPIGVKLAAGHHLEQDLDWALAAGVDVIAIDGSQAATKGGPPTVEDDFGLPTLYALCRAARHLGKVRRSGNSVSTSSSPTLIVGGGLATPGEYLKCIALGADAIYLGTQPLFALTHTQLLKAVPFEPPTQVVFAAGRYHQQLDVNQAARNLANFLTSSALEMAEGVRALGKHSLRELGTEDLCALDLLTAAITGVDLAYKPARDYLPRPAATRTQTPSQTATHPRWQHRPIPVASVSKHPSPPTQRWSS